MNDVELQRPVPSPAKHLLDDVDARDSTASQPKGSLWQNDMQQRKCKFCERTFTKTEHLSRHQRSHTGEKPYKCGRCPKRFARSDVLTRHQKAHVQPTSKEPFVSGENIDGGDDSPTQIMLGVPSPVSVHSIHLAEDPTHRDKLPSICSVQSSPQRSSSQMNPEPVSVPVSHTRNDRFDPSLANLLSTNDPEVGSPALDMPMSEITDWGLQHSVPSQPADLSIANTNLIFPAGPRFQSLQAFGNNSSYDSAINIPAIDDSNIAPFRPNFPAGDGLTPGGEFTIGDDFQSWFDRFDSGVPGGDDFAVFDRESSQAAAFLIQPQTTHDGGHRRKSTRSRSEAHLVPKERFARVNKCWWDRSGNGIRAMHTLWHDVVRQPENNLFDDPGSPCKPPTTKRRDGLRRGLNQEVRERLKQSFSARYEENDTVLSHADKRGRVMNPYSIEDNCDQFPPAEILDIGLDRYFQHFHITMPFVHVPSFSASTTNSTLLFLMCLIGLTIINTKGATMFIQKSLSMVLKVLDEQLLAYRPGNPRGNIDLSAVMASCVLAMALAEIVGEKADMALTGRMYLQMITQAQEQQLFATGDNQPRGVLEEAFEYLSDVDSRWKAWARVESAKRLIICILLCDSWNSTVQHTCPIIRTENIRLVIPCNSALFEADSSNKWLENLNKGHQLTMLALVLSPRTCTLPKSTKQIEVLGIYGILCSIRLRISEDYHRLLSTHHRGTSNTFVAPWEAFAKDPQTRLTQALVIDAMTTYGDMLNKMNPNCMALWHNMCLMLTADFRIFELGAGSAGASAAQGALENITLWSQTTAARRAIIHAAQTFQLMSNRKPSDGDPFHASNGLFLSALVLGLYVFMVPPEGDDEDDEDEDIAPYELMDDVDWNVVGQSGISFDDSFVDDAAVSFIRKGGPISISGVIHRAGYESARRILLDFSCLLEDIEKWRIGHYTTVLRIMSDSLIDKSGR